MALTPEQEALNFNPELQDVSRQQKLAELLMAQGMQGQPQGQMISGHYVAPSWTQQLNPMANVLAGQAVGARADTQKAELAAALRQKQTTQIEQFGELESKDKAGALRYALTSGNPILQDIAKEELKGMKLGKGEVFTRTSLGGGTTKLEGNPDLPESIQYAISVGGLPANPATWNEQQRAYAKSLVESKANASANRMSMNVQNQLPFKEQIQKEAASGLMKNFETLQNIPSTLQNMDKMVKLSQQPIYAGVGGETKLQIAKLLNNNFGTNINPDAVKNTEEFKSAAYMGIMENLKKTDSNPTMAQQNALKDAIGSLGTDPSALPRVVNVMRDVLVNKAEQHNRLVQQTMQNGVQYPYSIEVPLPKVNANMQNNNVMSAADAILNRKPGAPQ